MNALQNFAHAGHEHPEHGHNPGSSFTILLAVIAGIAVGMTAIVVALNLISKKADRSKQSTNKDTKK